MAYKIVNNKVVHISPPNNLSKSQSKRIKESKVPTQMLNLLEKMRKKELEMNGRHIRLSY